MPRASDPGRLGLGVVAFISVTMARGHLGDMPKFQDLISDMPQILECYSVTGENEFVMVFLRHR